MRRACRAFPLRQMPMGRCWRSGGQALRCAGSSTASSQATGEEEMSSLATRLEALADAFSSMPEKISRSGFATRMTAEDVRDFIEFSPLDGLSTTRIAPQLCIWVRRGQGARAGKFQQGLRRAPGLVHGGHVAAAFDELLGFAQGSPSDRE